MHAHACTHNHKHMCLLILSPLSVNFNISVDGAIVGEAKHVPTTMRLNEFRSSSHFKDINIDHTVHYLNLDAPIHIKFEKNYTLKQVLIEGKGVMQELALTKGQYLRHHQSTLFYTTALHIACLSFY